MDKPEDLRPAPPAAKEPRLTESAKFWIAQGLAAATVIAALLVYWQTREQVEIANKQLRMADTAMYDQMRAYVSVLPPSGEPILVDKKQDFVRTVASFIMKNTGQTMACSVGVYGYIRIVDTDSIDLLDPTKLPKANPIMPLGAGLEFKVWNETPYDTKRYGSVFTASSRIRLVCYGRVDYKDIYGVAHWTTFAYEWMHWINTAGGKGVGFYPRALFNAVDANRE